MKKIFSRNCRFDMKYTYMNMYSRFAIKFVTSFSVKLAPGFFTTKAVMRLPATGWCLPDTATS